MISVIIAAHNEEAVIGRCLDALADGGLPMQVIVSANGCRDATVEVARSRNVFVVERAEAGKPGALNAAEQIATGSARIYLDADIFVPPGSIAALVEALDAERGFLAVVPRRHVDISGRPWPVRAYFRINQRLPAFRTGLFGRGLIVISEIGRSRFEEFPELIADDLFLDAQFADREKIEVGAVTVVVESPRTTGSLFKRLVRVRRGNAEMRRAAAEGGVDSVVRRSDRWSWLRDVVLRQPWLALDAVAYVGITMLAAYRARRAPRGDWGRDESTRMPAQEAGRAAR